MKIEIPEQLIDVVKAGVKANREVPGSIAKLCQEIGQALSIRILIETEDETHEDMGL